MAEKKQHKIVSASTGEAVKPGKKPASAAVQQTGNATGLRVGAFILWIAAIAFEVLAILLFTEKLFILPQILPLYKAIAALIPDAICVIIGSQLWKKANHIDPASQKNELKFWLWNNMGVLVSAVAFLPFIVILLTDKKADAKTKAIGTVVAAVLLAVSGLASYDWNPVSQEAVAEAAAGAEVYWVKNGTVYHYYEDCGHLNRSEELILGSAQEAFDAGKTKICSTCFKRHEREAKELSTANAPAVSVEE